MFVELLEALLGDRGSEARLRPEEALAELVRCRRRLAVSDSGGTGGHWAVGAIADHLAYDAALIRYSRCMGVECDPRRFGAPGVERYRVERLLESRGIPLDL